MAIDWVGSSKELSVVSREEQRNQVQPQEDLAWSHLTGLVLRPQVPMYV